MVQPAVWVTEVMNHDVCVVLRLDGLSCTMSRPGGRLSRMPAPNQGGTPPCHRFSEGGSSSALCRLLAQRLSRLSLSRRLSSKHTRDARRQTSSQMVSSSASVSYNVTRATLRTNTMLCMLRILDRFAAIPDTEHIQASSRFHSANMLAVWGCWDCEACASTMARLRLLYASLCMPFVTDVRVRCSEIPS